MRILKVNQEPLTVNNADFYRSLNVIDFLRDIGIHHIEERKAL